MPISNNDPMYPEMTPDQIARMQAAQQASAGRQAFDQMQFADLNREWLGQADQLRSAPGANERAGNAKGYMGQQRSNQTRNWNAQRQVPYGASFDQVAKSQADRAGYLRSLAGDTNYMDPARGGFVEPMQPRLEGPQGYNWDEHWANQKSRPIKKAWSPSMEQLSPEQQAYNAMQREWMGAPDKPVVEAFRPQARVGGGEMPPMRANQWDQFWAGQPNKPVTNAFRPQAYADPMKELRMAGTAVEAAPAAAAAAAGGRAAGVAGAARGAMGMFGGPMALGAFGVLNNAVDLSNPNSVMRKAIHDGNYGTALARGAANFIPFAGTIWDNLSGNNHPEQPTVNQPQQATDPETPLDLTGAFPGDPLNHGNYTSRQEMQENYKLQKMFEPKPQVEAAQNQMRMLSRDVAMAKASGDEKRLRLAMDNYMKFERLLALGQNSYPYMTSAMTPVEYDWLGGQ